MARKPLGPYTGRGARLGPIALDGVALDLSLDARNLRRLRRLESVSRLLAAQSLTFTAERAVPAWRAGHRVFHRRNNWIDKGVTHRHATPGNLNARVGTVDKYMGRHVLGIGEEKRGHLFIPAYKSISDALTHTQERRKLKGYERTKRKPFRINNTLVRRKGKARLPLITLGKIQDGADVPEQLDALGIVSGVVNAQFPPIYERLLLKWAST